MSILAGEHVHIHQGLEDQDEHIEALMSLWMQLQFSVLELAAQPESDLLSFAQTGFFLGVIRLNEIDTAATEEDSSAPLTPPVASQVTETLQVVKNKKKKKKGKKDATHDSKEKNKQKKGQEDSTNGPKLNVGQRAVSDRPAPQSGGASHAQLPSTSSVPTAEVPQVVANNAQPAANAHRGAIGLIYLSASPFTQSAPNQIGELNLGIILDSEYRGHGYAREAIELTIKHAFEVEHCHRIQASLLDSDWAPKDRMVALLTQLRFGHEGTRRRAFYNPMVEEWQDVTTLAILETDWSIRMFLKPAPKSLWDELFLRHERERDELLRWDDMQSGTLKRSASTETLRAHRRVGGLDLGDEKDASAAGMTDSDGYHSVASSKGKKPQVKDDSASSSSDDGESSPSDVVFERSSLRAVSPTPSDSSVESVPLSVVSTGSEWDFIESSPSSPGSSFGDESDPGVSA